ncbi:MAG: hypothetical protein ACRDH7_16650 [Actinomycetota bacterium]
MIEDAIDAGYDSLEHASFLGLDQVKDVAARGIAWVPTRSIDAGSGPWPGMPAAPPTSCASTTTASIDSRKSCAPLSMQA